MVIKLTIYILCMVIFFSWLFTTSEDRKRNYPVLLVMIIVGLILIAWLSGCSPSIYPTREERREIKRLRKEINKTLPDQPDWKIYTYQ